MAEATEQVMLGLVLAYGFGRGCVNSSTLGRGMLVRAYECLKMYYLYMLFINL